MEKNEQKAIGFVGHYCFPSKLISFSNAIYYTVM